MSFAGFFCIWSPHVVRGCNRYWFRSDIPPP